MHSKWSKSSTYGCSSDQSASPSLEISKERKTKETVWRKAGVSWMLMFRCRCRRVRSWPLRCWELRGTWWHLSASLQSWASGFLSGGSCLGHITSDWMQIFPGMNILSTVPDFAWFQALEVWLTIRGIKEGRRKRRKPQRADRERGSRFCHEILIQLQEPRKNIREDFS